MMKGDGVTKIALFASGTGSNFVAIAQAIAQGKIAGKIELLVCDQPNAMVIEKAKKYAISQWVFNARHYPDKADYEREILQQLQKHQVTWIVLAGYMRLIGKTLLDAYPRHIINIHPSLLPHFKGKDAIKRAVDAQKETENKTLTAVNPQTTVNPQTAISLGVTIHYVDAGMDSGEIIVQEALICENNESLHNITTKVHALEHRLYPATLAKLLNGD